MTLRVLGCVVLAALSAFAQSDRGTLTGTVADPAGAVVAGAQMEIRNVETGATSQAASTDTGNYTLPQLPVGSYELTVTVPGFKKYVRQRIVIQVAQTLRLDVTLEVGAVSDSVTVTSETTMLKTESAELSHVVPVQRLQDLPILAIGGAASSSQGLRFYLAQTQLIPGTSYSNGVNSVRVNGAPNGTFRTQIEGMDATNALIPFSAASLQPSIDAVEETNIQTSNYAAEFGQVGGGLFNITMRSGTNSYHGGVFDYIANEAFNAATPFVNKNPRIRRNNYGFSFGGPVIIPKIYNGKDKFFFFYNREQYREFFQVNNAPITVPTAAYRSGNFASIIPANARTLSTDPQGRPVIEGTIFDPATTRPAANGQVFRDAFVGNIIPVARQDKVALAIQNLIPAAGTSALTNNLTPSFPNDRVTTNESVKIDYQLSSKAKISGYFGTNATGSQYSQQLNGSEGLPAPITATRGTFTQSYTWRVNTDYTLAPTMLLHMGAGFVFYPFNDNAPTLDYDSTKSLGLVGATVLGAAGGRFPQITGLCQTGASPACTGFGGTASMGPGPQARSYLTTPTGNTSLSWVKDNHTYKFGAEVRVQGFEGKYFTGTNGQYAFSSGQTAQPYLGSSTFGGGNLGFPYASFLLGQVNNGLINSFSTARTGKTQWGFFAQDNWKITRKLTLDYGLRYDYSTYPREQYGRLPTLSPTLANPTAGGHPGGTTFEGDGAGHCNCSFAKNYPFAFGPRIGIAYQITSKTVLRAGYGLIYNGTPGVGQTNASSNNPFLAPNFYTEALTLQNGIPSNYVAPWPSFDPGKYPLISNPAGLAGPPVVVDQNAGRPARQGTWSIGLQREISKNLVVEASYVGNRGVWWPSAGLNNYNALTPQILANYGLDVNSAADRAILRGTLGTAAAGRFQNKLPYAGFPTTATVAQSLRVYPQFASGLNPLWSPQGKTWYDSLQMKVTQRFSHGLDFTYTFTYQKELVLGADSDSAGLGGSGAVNDVFNRNINKQISSFSRPLVSVIAANYRLPALGGNKYLSFAARDWTLGAVLQYASGVPILSPSGQKNLNTLYFRNTFANRVAGVDPFLKDLNCHCLDPDKDLVLNPAAWQDPADGQFGTAAAYHNDYRYQRRPSENINFGRVFRIREKMSLSMRMEFSNI
ncbi:MAG: TonB-dependent receptor, partial [Acidobacteriota bacterium]